MAKWFELLPTEPSDVWINAQIATHLSWDAP